MTFWEFRENLSKKVITYKPTISLYRGDENIMVSVAQIPKQIKRGIPNKENCEKNTTTFNTFKREQHTRHKAGRLCGDLELFQKHVFTKGNMDNPKASEMCGIYSYSTCGLYKVSVHYFTQKGGQKSQN